VQDPLRAPIGNVLLDWVFPLHSGEALGFAARLLWTLFGVVPALLLGSGLCLWWRRMRQRPQGQAARSLRTDLPANPQPPQPSDLPPGKALST
jgi:uncharacterized iron-regulated membrane protein